jgi:arylsulfatase A-like enzyme
LVAAVLLSLSLTVVVHGQAPAITHLVIVVDGLRPDYVTPEVMPRLARIGRRGIVFTAHHAVFPTVTRVNASSFVTGTYPETHGLLGNTIYIPSVDPVRGLDTGDRENLEKVERVERRLLTAPTIGEILSRQGKMLLALSSGSTGSSYLLNHTVGTGAIVHTEYVRPIELGPRVLAAVGPVPPHAMPNDAQNHYAIDAYLKLGLTELHPDVTFMWLNDPDGTAHEKGIGDPLSRTSLTLVDAAIGHIEDVLQSKGLLNRTNILVTSDHGFSTHTGELDLSAIVEPFAKQTADGTKDIVVAEGAIYLRGGDPGRLTSIVSELQRRPEVGAIFTRPGPLKGQGVVQGTLSYDVARWNHPRSGDVLVSANWTSRANPAGFKGTTTQDGVAGHGSSSPYDIHNTLIAAGPGFRTRAVSAVPTANVDLAPTLLQLLGIPIPAGMTGRVIKEGLRNGPAPSSVPVTHRTITVQNQDGSYELTAHISTAGGADYLDNTDVIRRSGGPPAPPGR